MKSLNRSKEFKVDFLGIGAERGGTTWLAKCLEEHPEINFAKMKEVFFFNKFDPHFLKAANPNYERGLIWYQSNFWPEKSGLRGEFSPTYLFDMEAARRIKKHNQEVKLVLVLRDPVDRAYSQYLNDVSMGLVPEIGFEKAVKKYKSLLEKGLYAKYLKTYFTLFPRKNFFICLNEDIQTKPAATVKKLYSFLGLKDTNFKPECLYRKVDPVVRSRIPWFNSLLVRAQYVFSGGRLGFFLAFIEKSGLKKFAIYLKTINTKETKKEPIKISTRRKLQKFYTESVKELEKLINRDLSLWMVNE